MRPITTEEVKIEEIIGVESIRVEHPSIRVETIEEIDTEEEIVVAREPTVHEIEIVEVGVVERERQI